MMDNTFNKDTLDDNLKVITNTNLINAIMNGNFRIMKVDILKVG